MLNATQQEAISVLLVDDHPVVRMGYTTLLKRRNSALVFHEAATREEALALLETQTPKLALTDLNLTDSVELTLIGELRSKAPDMPILVVSMHDEMLYALRALQAGAQGYLMKHHAAQSITQAVQHVLEGKVWLSEDMRGAAAPLSPQADGTLERFNQKFNELSDHELEVFRLHGAGLKKAEIAARLGVANDNVDTHRSNLKHLLGVATNAELYRMAFLRFQHDGMSKR